MRPEKIEKAYFSYIPIEKIRSNKLNPRRMFDRASIQDLAASFAEYGMIQPILLLLAPVDRGDIAGVDFQFPGGLAEILDHPG